MLCHNYGEYILSCLKSVEDQIFNNWELVIVDDNSDDGSWELIQSFAAGSLKNVRTHRNKTTEGLKKSSNTAIKMCLGDYVIRLDADDWMLDICLLALYEKIISNPAAQLCYGGYFYVDKVGKIIGQEIPLGYRGVAFPPHGACTLIQRRLLISNGGFLENFDTQDGWDLFYRVNQSGEVATVESPLFYYRQHSSSLSRSIDRQLKSRRTLFNSLTEKKVASVYPTLVVTFSIFDFAAQKNTIELMISKITQLQRASPKIGVSVFIYCGITELDEVEAYFLSHVNLVVSVAAKPDLISAHDHKSLLQYILNNLLENSDADIWCYLNLNNQLYDHNLILEHYQTLLNTTYDQVVSIGEERMPCFRLSDSGLATISWGKYDDLFSSDDLIYAHTGEIIMGWLDSDGTFLFENNLGYVQVR